MSVVGPVGVGQLVLRIAQINECHSIFHPRRENSIEFWEGFVREFFNENAVYKHIVWVNNKREVRKFELGTEALPRMYQVTYASGVRQIMYFMENPREYSINDRTYLLISTKTKVFMLYENGTEVHITGYLRVTFCNRLKVLLWEFEGTSHDELVLKNREETPQHSNGSKEGQTLVNEFGLPPPLMRCFEIAEVTSYMKDLIDFSTERGCSPLESLEKYHKEMKHLLLQAPPSQNGTSSYYSSLSLPPGVSTGPSLIDPNPQSSDHEANGTSPSNAPNNNSNTRAATANNAAANKRRRSANRRGDDDGPPNKKLNKGSPSGGPNEPMSSPAGSGYFSPHNGDYFDGAAIKDEKNDVNNEFSEWMDDVGHD
jgi:hypothetical protein